MFYHFGKQQWYTFGTHMRMYPHLRRTEQNAFWEVVVLILDHSTAGSISSLSLRSDHWRGDFIALP